MPEYLPKQRRGTVQNAEDSKVHLVSEPFHPRQLRRREIGLVGNVAYIGLGRGQYLTLSVGGTQQALGTQSTPIPPGGGGGSSPVVPGGANDAVQFNDTGEFGGFGDYNKASDLLTIAQALATIYLETPEVRAPDDLTLNPTGDAVVLKAGKKFIWNG